VLVKDVIDPWKLALSREWIALTNESIDNGVWQAVTLNNNDTFGLTEAKRLKAEKHGEQQHRSCVMSIAKGSRREGKENVQARSQHDY
jgi:hypothetical protein